MAKKGHLSLADATEDEIREMQDNGFVDDGEPEPSRETDDDKANRGSGRAPANPVEFSPADPVERVAKAIIEEHYPELRHQRIEYIFTTVGRKKGGNIVPATTKVLTGIPAYLALCLGEHSEAEPFFVIEIFEKLWNEISDQGRVNLMDHQLAFCGVRKRSGALFIKQPDTQAFREVAMRRGHYTKDIENFVVAVKKGQGELDLAG